MKQIGLQYLCAVLLLGVTAAATAEPSIQRPDGVYGMTGFAKSLETGEPVYREIHRLEVIGGRIQSHTVDYVAPDGRPVSEKSISYDRNPYLPEFQLRDARDDYREGAGFSDSGYRVFRDAPNKERRSKTFRTGPNHVADAGFDSFVRANMDTLLAGQTLEFKFIVAGFLDKLSFRARMVEADMDDERSATFLVEPDSLLRVFVDPIRVTYDTRTGDLLRYEGVTNIRDGEGKRFRAVIEYPTEQRRYEPARS